MTEYMKIWLLEDFVVGPGVDWGSKGTAHFWRIIEEYEDGDLMVERGGKRALLWAADVKAGQRHSKPDFQIPIGLHLGLERGYYRKWWGKFYKPTENAV